MFCFKCQFLWMFQNKLGKRHHGRTLSLNIQQYYKHVCQTYQHTLAVCHSTLCLPGRCGRSLPVTKREKNIWSAYTHRNPDMILIFFLSLQNEPVVLCKCYQSQQLAVFMCIKSPSLYRVSKLSQSSISVYQTESDSALSICSVDAPIDCWEEVTWLLNNVISLLAISSVGGQPV